MKLVNGGRPDQQEGAITIALIFMMVASLLLTMVLAAITQEIRKTKHDRSFTSALPAADAGIQQALAYLNTARALPSATDPPVTGTTRQATGTVSYSWYADKDAFVSGVPQSYTVHSTTTVNGVTRTVHAQLYQDQLFKYALFADQSIDFNGNNTATSYPATGGGQLASNGTMTLRGAGSTTADSCLLFDNNPTAPVASRVNGGVCSSPQNGGPVQDTTSAAATRFMREQIDRCKVTTPTLPVYTGAYPLAAGTTYCFSSINLPTRAAPTVLGTAANPTKVYVEGNVTLDLSAYWNFATTTSPDASGFQLYSLGSSVNFGVKSKIAAAIWAPLASCLGGAQVEIYGSMVCSVVDNVGNWTFRYDQRLTSVGGGGWRFRHYTEYR